MAHVLAAVDPAELAGPECVEVLKAQYRLLNHTKARLMAMMVEVGLRDGVARMAAPDEFSADEIRAALVLTRRAVDAQLDLAHDLVTRLPAVHAAMDAGVLDEPKARVFADRTGDLTDLQARTLCAELLPRTPAWTTGQLVERIKRHAIALDPDWTRRRYESAVAERRVVGYRNPDGSANLSGMNLPVDRVAAASERIDALAKSVKNAGDSRPIDHIRADLFMGMTDGTYAGLDDATIIEQILGTSPMESADGDRVRSERNEVPDAPATDPADRGPARPGTELLALAATPATLGGWASVIADLVHRLGRGPVARRPAPPTVGHRAAPPTSAAQPATRRCGGALVRPEDLGRPAAAPR